MNILNNTSREDINSKISKNQFNIYQNDISQQAKQAEQKIVNRYHRNARNPKLTGIIPVDRNYGTFNSQEEDVSNQFVYSKLTG